MAEGVVIIAFMGVALLGVAFLVFLITRLWAAIAFHTKNQESMIQLLQDIRDTLARKER